MPTSSRSRAGRVVLSAAVASLLAAGVAGGAPVPAGSHLRNLVARSWQLEDGLPQNHVAAIAQTADGFLWVGTQEGLARFDGIEFAVLSVRSCPAFRHSRVYALAEGRDRTLWVGTADGLVRLGAGEPASISTAEGLSHPSVQALAVDREGRVWVGTRGGLDQIVDGRAVPFGARLGLSDPYVSALAADPSSGALWVGTYSAGLLRLEGDQVRRFATADGLPADQVNALAVDRDGRLWVATFAGLAVLDGQRFRTFTEADGLSSRRCQGLWVDGDGAVWVGTANGGLNRFLDGRFAAFTAADGLSEQSVTSILRDREGNLWVGTLGGGLNRLQDYGLALYTTRDGLSSDVVSAVLEDRFGRVWAGTWESGLNLVDRGAVRSFHVADGLPDEAVQSLLEDRSGRVWVGTRGGLAVVGADGAFTPVELPGRFDVRAMVEDRAGVVWVGTYGHGVFRSRHGALEHLTVADGLTSDYVVTLREEASGAMLVGTDGRGVCRVVGDRAAPVARHPDLDRAYVRAFWQDPAGSIWVGTSGTGLLRLRGGAVTAFRERDGLWSDKVFALLERDGLLWLTCNRGVFRVSLEALAAFADGRLARIPCDVFGREPGVGNLECNGGYTPAGWKGRDGRLWIGTVQGLAVLDPQRVELGRVPPLVMVEQLEVDRESVPLDDPVRLRPGARRVQVRYVGLAFTAPRSLAYRYRLEGLEEEWVDAGARREVNYTNLRPGCYRFVVEACSGSGLCSPEPAVVVLDVAAPFWRSWWFLGTVALAAGGLVYSLGKWRQVLAHRRERERMEIARQLTVGILHELRQPLQVVQSRLEILRLRPSELEAGLDSVFAQLGRLRGLLGQLEELQHRRSLRTRSYARDDTMVDLSDERDG